MTALRLIACNPNPPPADISAQLLRHSILRLRTARGDLARGEICPAILELDSKIAASIDLLVGLLADRERAS
jgi:hypothetical protein